MMKMTERKIRREKKKIIIRKLIIKKKERTTKKMYVTFHNDEAEHIDIDRDKN